jgi:hypothetical protein
MPVQAEEAAVEYLQSVSDWSARLLRVASVLFLLGGSADVLAAPPVRRPATSATSAGSANSAHSKTQEVEKPLQISGQTRNLSMTLGLRNDKDKVTFANVRRDFRDKIPLTYY